MDDRRFDSLTRALAGGANRRAVLKGLLGLGGVIAGSTMLDDSAEAARRSKPTPRPASCPGQQTWDGSACGCPDDAPYVCGPACCTGEAGGLPTPDHSECCDNACCFGTCYGEELCCPTNWGPGEQPPTNQVCESANGPECCAYSDVCCDSDGCCATVCYDGLTGNDRCCSVEEFCPGAGTEDLCCSSGTYCCGGDTDANICIDPEVEGSCCVDTDCGDPCQVCDPGTHLCGPLCDGCHTCDGGSCIAQCSESECCSNGNPPADWFCRAENQCCTFEDCTDPPDECSFGLCDSNTHVCQYVGCDQGQSCCNGNCVDGPCEVPA